jgi:hypothetical protein
VILKAACGSDFIDFFCGSDFGKLLAVVILKTVYGNGF